MSRFKNTINTWEDFKIKVAKIYHSYGKMQASTRRTIIEMGKEMKTQNFIKKFKKNQKEEKLQNFNLRGNFITAKKIKL